MRKQSVNWVVGFIMILIGFTVFLFGETVYAGEGTLDGYVMHRSEYGFREPRRYSVSEFDVLINSAYKFDEKLQARVIVKGTYDAIYDLSDNSGLKAAINADPSLRSGGPTNEGDAYVQEVYFDYNPIRDLRLRLGKQMLTWGEADGLQLMDKINPQDLRRGYLTRDLEDRKIGLWMARLNYDLPMGDQTNFEFLFMPDFQLSKIAPEGAAWAPVSPVWLNTQFAGLAEAGLVPVIADNRRSRTLANSRYGAKLSTNIAGADISLNYLYSYGDAPVFNFKGVGPGPTFNLAQNYPSTNLVGATVNYDIGLGVLRGEFSYEFKKKFQNVTMPDWTEESDYFKAMVGFDYHLVIPGWNRDRSIFISGQAFNFHIMDHNSNIINIPYGYNIKKDETYFSLLMNTGFISDVITPQMFVFYDASYNQWWINPSVGFKQGTYWRFEAGANWFEGKNDQRLPLGAFKHDSTAYLQIKRMF